MRRWVLVGVLLVGGLTLMANPLYLPVAVAEPTPVYTHVVQPIGDDTPAFDEDDVVDGTSLDPDAREAFDRARTAEGNGFVATEPDDRIGSLSYPSEPTVNDGLLIVSIDGERYEFWTRTVEREPGVVLVQRVVLQPVAFLVGFLGLVGAVAVAFRDQL